MPSRDRDLVGEMVRQRIEKLRIEEDRLGSVWVDAYCRLRDAIEGGCYNYKKIWFMFHREKSAWERLQRAIGERERLTNDLVSIVENLGFEVYQTTEGGK